MDRTALAGLGGTLATVGLGTIHAVIGIIAGVSTIIYMTIKIYQLLKK
jgi:hypothetical protein